MTAVSTAILAGGLGTRIGGDKGLQLLHGKALSHYRERDEFPPETATTDQQLLEFARQRGGTAWHLMGTCRMGPASDPGSVVDSALRVIGSKK